MSHHFSKTVCCVVALSLAVALSWPALAPRQNVEAAALTGEAIWTHDPSRIIECDGKYYLYTTGDKLPMKTSTDLVNWTKGPSVLPKVPDWARKAVPAAKTDFVWAPDVIFLNNKYYLYYSFSTFGSIVSVTGLVTSPTLDPASPAYKWTDEGLIVASKAGSDFNAIDPAPLLDANGDLWLTVGSWNKGGIKLLKLDKTTGKMVGEAQTIAAGQATGPEAPYLHFRDGYYYLFENEGTCYGWPFAGSDVRPGRYAIFSKASGLALGIHNNNFADGTPIDQAVYRGGATQQWNVTPTGDGYYGISSLGTAKWMDLSECSAKDGTKISHYPWFNNDCQRWSIEQVGQDTYRIISRGGKTALTLPGGVKTPQAPVQGWAWKGDAGQQWIFQKLP